MEKITKYKVVEHESPSDLVKEIEKLISDGYQPYGNLIVDETNGKVWYTQAMVK
jgi:hypothetical protein